MALQLKMEFSLIIASLRCLGQLTVMAYVLGPVLDSEQAWVPFLMAGVFILLGAYETVFHQAKVRHRFMLPVVLLAIILSTGVIGFLGLGFVIRATPFYQPQQFVPIIGLLLGNSMSGMAVGITHALKTLSSNKDHIETYLSMGATRWEASRPIAIKSIQLGMIPTINAMSVMGIISIPGMMTGQILGGTDVFVAVRYQQVSMFMILASTALGILISVTGALMVSIDQHHRYRPDRIFDTPAWQERLFKIYVTDPFSNLKLKLKHKFFKPTPKPIWTEDDDKVLKN